jgi:hypothetical protein
MICRLTAIACDRDQLRFLFRRYLAHLLISMKAMPGVSVAAKLTAVYVPVMF